MSINTGGPIRGFISRWLMRLQAIQGFIQMGSMLVTAASTLTFALQAIGYTQLAPYVLAISFGCIPAFAWIYTEMGVYNRKNRENSDRGANWAGPDAYINSVIGATGTFYAMNGRPPTQAELEDIEESVRRAEKYRDGIDVPEFFDHD